MSHVARKRHHQIECAWQAHGDEEIHPLPGQLSANESDLLVLSEGDEFVMIKCALLIEAGRWLPSAIYV